MVNLSVAQRAEQGRRSENPPYPPASKQTCQSDLNRVQFVEQLDGVGPVDNRPSTDQLHPFVQLFFMIFIF